MARNVWLKLVVATSIVAVGAVMPAPASATFVRNQQGGACAQDGSACDVWCGINPALIGKWRAGTMYWNGSVWSDGVRWNVDPYVEAGEIAAAAGAACDQWEG
jgi:hypothetical protein